ncbi:hypothetical protein HYPSUDRAFT_598387 [Hypholoma sublateritium FD-334 SS-4]|uniref:Uncharacterized protein n=1 Tax=Hypholoma sublateritium (strain FD-334 SS-4) TaxID=945553 RepID=A0A0D2MI31_HYPSF|nr:hypothetical protein HYPSUDRAFT_598387 [Hypholoma sublateritium FD-334 SS-4]
MFGKLISVVIIASSLIMGVAAKHAQLNRLSQYFSSLTRGAGIQRGMKHGVCRAATALRFTSIVRHSRHARGSWLFGSTSPRHYPVRRWGLADTP